MTETKKEPRLVSEAPSTTAREKGTSEQEESLHEVALAAHRVGISVFPVKEDGSKAPDGVGSSWEPYEPTRLDQIDLWFKNSNRSGLAVKCGRVSGDIEVLDVEGKAVEEGVWDEFKKALKAAGLGLLLKRITNGYGERTPTGGYHVLYRCPVPRSGKLAGRSATLTEKERSSQQVYTLMETKGEGGYVIVAPSNGSVHPSGNSWEMISGGFGSLATITQEERDELARVARTFDESPPRKYVDPAPQVPRNLPGDEFNWRGTWEEVDLKGAGWTLVYQRRETEYWRRPGKTTGISATLNHGGHGLFHVFSSSTAFPEPDRSYKKFSVYAYLHHDGDFKAAKEALLARGYEGEQVTEDQKVANEYRRLLIRDRAQTQLRNEKAAAQFVVPPSQFTAAEFLELELEEQSYTVGGIHPFGGNTLLAAAYKAGKTTLLMNLTQSLLSGAPFLGHPVRELAGRVAFFNYELSERQFQGWLKDMELKGLDRAAVLNLRGYRLPLTVPHIEDWVVNWLQEREVEFWIIDTFAKAFSGSGSENNNDDVGPWLETLDVIKQRAGVKDLAMSAHFGRAGLGKLAAGDASLERARGASVLDGWADARWVYTIAQEGRFFSADGRDVYEEESRLSFNPTTRHLDLVGGNRREESFERLVSHVGEVVAREPGINTGDLIKAMSKGTKTDRPRAIEEAIRRSEILVEKEGKAHKHFHVSRPKLKMAKEE